MPALHLLGPPEWQRPDGSRLVFGPERRHQLLALLAYESVWVGRERLSSLFWPQRPERAARANLRKVLHELRALHVGDLEDGAEGLRWLPGTDVEVFRQAWAQGDWQRAADAGAGLLMQGLDEAHGGTAFGDWLRAERVQWQSRWRDAVLQAAPRSDAPRAWDLAERLLQVDVLDEEAMGVALRASAALQRPELARPWWERHVQRLRDELGCAPGPALQALAHGEVAPRIAPLAPLVGRDSELQELLALLSSGRLVTVLGAGGVGKTRLVRHAADAVAPRFAQGVVFVPLEDARTPDEVPARIAAALGLNLGGHGDLLQTLARALAAQTLLIVLDGFEVVIDAGPSLLRLLAAAPGLRIVTTSRERLAVDGEWLLPMSGLATPAHGAAPEQVLRSQAVTLFVARARAVNPAFDAGAALGPVAEICRRLEGLPLALELAAAWVRLLPAAEIASELARGVEFLAGGHDANLRPLFDRSWAMLTAVERDAQARLAVFRGGFTRAAAREVAGVELVTLAALVDKSMLSARPDGRFGMHALLQPQVRQKLLAHADADAMLDSHSRWFLALARLPGADLSAEHDNLLAAWQHAVARRDAAAIEAVLFALPWGAMVRGRLGDAAALLGAAAAAFGTDQAAGAQLLAHHAWMLLWQEQRQAAQTLAAQALQTLRGAGHAAGTVMALRTLGHAARMEGDHERAALHLADGLAVAQQAGLAALEAVMHDGLAMALNMLGRHGEARDAVAAAAVLNGDSGDAVQRLYHLYNRSQSHSLAGEPALALPWAEQALALAERIGHLAFVPYARIELALVELALGRPGLSQAEVRQARQLAQELEDGTLLAATHEAGARVALAEGDVAQARLEVATAARLCLRHESVLVSAALVLCAARLPMPPALAGRWLRALLDLPVVQEPVRRAAAAALQGLPAAPDTAAPPATLAGLLAEVLAHA